MKEVTKGIANLNGEEEMQVLGENVIQAIKKGIDSIQTIAAQPTRYWYDQECERETKKRSELRLQMLKDETEEKIKKYQDQTKRCEKLYRQKKRKYLKEKIEEIERYHRNKEV